MKKLIYLFALTILVSGCATLSPREDGYITTIPLGASAYLYEPATGKKVFLGNTPCNYWIKRGFFEAYVVLEKDGYNQEEIAILPRGANISISVNLEESYGSRIKKEKNKYSKEFINASLDTLGLCKKALHSPRFLAAGVVSEAATSLDKLKLSYSSEDDKALIQALGKAIDSLEAMSSLGSDYYNSREELELVSEANRYISEINYGLGL